MRAFVVRALVLRALVREFVLGVLVVRTFVAWALVEGLFVVRTFVGWILGETPLVEQALGQRSFVEWELVDGVVVDMIVFFAENGSVFCLLLTLLSSVCDLTIHFQAVKCLWSLRTKILLVWGWFLWKMPWWMATM